MSFKLSKRSQINLRGVHPDVVKVVTAAIELTRVDFGVIEGVRSLEDQKANVAAGRSQTMASKHLVQEDGYGHAVDLMAYVEGKGCWELNVYDDVADAIAAAARVKKVPIRWGCAWHISDIRGWGGSMEEAMNDYIDLRRSQGRRPFLDGPHFELQEPLA